MKITINTMYSYVSFTDEPDEVKKYINNRIQKGLAIREDNYMYNPLVKRGLWDGFTNFYDIKDHKFPTGLLNDVLEIVGDIQEKYSDVSLEIKDNYPEDFIATEDFPETLTFKKGNKELTLRDYQYNAVKEAIRKHMGILNLAVNSGKTGTSMAIIKTLLPYMKREERVVYFVPSKAIFSQAIKSMQEQFGTRNVGYMGDGKRKLSKINVILMPSMVSALKKPKFDKPLSGKHRKEQIFVDEVYPFFKDKKNLSFLLESFIKNYEANTKARKDIMNMLMDIYKDNKTDSKIRLALNNEYMLFQNYAKSTIGDKYKKYEETLEFVKKVVLVITDEAHHSKADTYYNTILQFENAQYRFAMTGSVDKADKLMVQRLKALYESTVYVVSNKEMVDRGVSAKPTINLINIRDSVGIENEKDFAKAYDIGIVHNDFRNNVIVKFTSAMYKLGKPTLVIVNRVEHGEIIKDKLMELGVKSAFISGETENSEREEKKQELIDGKIGVLIATTIFDEGVDVAGIRALVLAAGLKSSRMVKQRVGRILRKKEKDNTALVFDFVDRTNRMLYAHSNERIKIYNNEKFDIKYLN